MCFVFFFTGKQKQKVVSIELQIYLFITYFNNQIFEYVQTYLTTHS